MYIVVDVYTSVSENAISRRICARQARLHYSSTSAERCCQPTCCASARFQPRYWANCIGQEGSLYERGSLLNHGCAANCTRVALDGGGAERAFVTLRPIAAGEELTLSYLPSGMEVMGTVVRRRHLWLSRGFLCHCDRCTQPQDEVRQVECPECCADGRRQRHSTEEALHTRDGHGEETQIRRPPSEEPAAFADWWNQSRMWVCRSCGWCSGDAETGTPCLRRNEAILSAEVFALVMGNTVARPPSPAATGGGSNACSADGRSPQAVGQQRQAKRDAVQGLLKASAALLGRRHWATFSCALLRLEQELSALSEKGSGPWQTLVPSRPMASAEFLVWAMQELNALWQWLSAALETATSHPPAYYLFDAVCGLLGLGEESAGRTKEMRELADRVEPWVSAFADEEQRRRFAAAAAVSGGTITDHRASRHVPPRS